jgi:hypothetical protein
MKEIVLSILCVLIIINIQAQNSFEVHFNNNLLNEMPFVFVNDNDGGFAGIVKKTSILDGAVNYYLYKISSDGDTSSVLFSKQDTSFRLGNLIRLNSEPPGYLLIGFGYTPEQGPFRNMTFLYRLNDNLEIIWEKDFLFDYTYVAPASEMMEDPNGDLLYCCTPQGPEMFLLKLSPYGDSLQFKEFQGTEGGTIFSMTYSSDSSNILLHTRTSIGIGFPECDIKKLDENWNLVDVTYYPWDYVPPTTATLLPSGKTLVNGCLLLGYRECYLTAYLLDEDLSIQYEFSLNHTDTTSRAAYSYSADYYEWNTYIGGTFDLYFFHKQDHYPSWFYVAKVNDTLGTIFEKYIGGDAAYELHCIAAASDGGVLLAGTREELYNDTTQYDGIIIKLDANGCITNLEDHPNIEIKEVLVYPNPGSDKLNIRTALDQCVFNLYDENGKLILTYNVTDKQTSLPTSFLRSGKYIYTFSRNGSVIDSDVWIKSIHF